MGKANGESRCQGNMEVQVATEGLIVLDIGVLMGSRSPQVFREMVDLYPTAKEIFEAIEELGCTCGNPLCVQDCFQTLITMDGQATKEEAAKFICFVGERGDITFERLREYQHEFFTTHLAPRLNQQNSTQGSVFQRLLSGDLFGPEVSVVALSPVEPEEAPDNLDHDEPEHSGPSEE